MSARTSTAVMARRVEPRDSLDFFPTPPWATRALTHLVLPSVGFERHNLRRLTVWDPCCGEGHMAGVLNETFGGVTASDIAEYRTWTRGAWPVENGLLPEKRDFLACADRERRHDMIVINPPFAPALRFIERALDEARIGVAALVRLQFLEGIERHGFWRRCQPAVYAPFAERVPMVAGRWAVNAKTASAYMWVFWDKVWAGRGLMRSIEPCRKRLHRDRDVLDYGGCSDLPQSHPVMRRLAAQEVAG